MTAAGGVAVGGDEALRGGRPAQLGGVGHGGGAQPAERRAVRVEQVELRGQGRDVAGLVHEAVHVVVEERARRGRHERDASGDLRLVGDERAALLEARQHQHVGACELVDGRPGHAPELDARVVEPIGEECAVVVVDGAEDQQPSLVAGRRGDPGVQRVMESLPRLDAAEEDRGQSGPVGLRAG